MMKQWNFVYVFQGRVAPEVQAPEQMQYMKLPVH